MDAASGSIKTSTVLITALKSCVPAIATTVVFSFFVNLLAFTSPLYMLQIYDRVIGSRNATTLLGITILVGFLLIVSALLEMLRSRVMVQAAMIVDGRLAGAVFDATHRAGLKLAALAEGQSLKDLDALREFVAGPSLIALCDLLWMPIFLVTCFMLHPWFGVLALAGSTIILLLTLLSEFATTRPLSQASRAASHATQKAVSVLRNGEVIHAMGMLGVLRDAWLGRHDDALALQAVAGRRSGLIAALSKFVRMFLQTMILGLGAYLAINNEISPGMIIAASIFIGRALAPVEGVVASWKVLTGARNSWARLVKLFAVAGEQGPRVALPRPQGHLRLDGVVAGPPSQSRATLRNIALDLAAGEMLGVIGPSAAGKSSLARVVTGVWPPFAGSVRLDGFDLSQWDPEDRGRYVGYLPQDVELFAGTVAQNIARFTAADSDAIMDTARLCGCHEMIQQLPDGYNTQIGEGGVTLSGGQRQRIGLARAFFGRPALVVLDEPNANLDQGGEKALAETLRRFRSFGCSIILITHKFALLGGADRILVMADGIVQAFGEREEIFRRILAPRPVAAAVAG
ncbi:MAG: type I secretion system permease/ATPase [Xanthobacteraceae bacterium]|nr:type I secretion system permease/ATPase [Xanthobacteraceae bacterium]